LIFFFEEAKEINILNTLSTRNAQKGVHNKEKTKTRKESQLDANPKQAFGFNNQ
jgi:hypothetical protein